jgi:hypothetical protein
MDLSFRRSSLGKALGAGLTGAVVLTAAHEALRRLRSDAPRMDVVGKRALKRVWRRFGARPPRGHSLYASTLAAELLTNTAYYAAVLLGRPNRPWIRQSAAGLLAGVSALALPPVIGLGFAPRSYRRTNRYLTIGLYLLGGLTAAAAYRQLTESSRK